MSEPKLVVSSVFERCQQFAQDLFADYAEPNAVLFTIDWKIGKNDFPAGTLVTREAITANTIVSLISQLGKQEQRLLQGIIDQLIRMQGDNVDATQGSPESPGR